MVQKIHLLVLLQNHQLQILEWMRRKLRIKNHHQLLRLHL